MLTREVPSRPNQLLMVPAANTVALEIKFPTHELWDKLKTIALDMSLNNNVTQYYFCETGIVILAYLIG